MQNFEKWRDDGKHLPYFLRDHDMQGEVFRYLCSRQTGEEYFHVNDAQAAVFIIDIFLWLLAASGYTLQKTRTKFNDINGFRDIQEDAHTWDRERHKRFMEYVMKDRKTGN